uniref:Uncharacterized protein n=1 Tax=Candidatus Kentrum sp. LPFa TaxID=2126335 RepID=A0A450X5L0_9GAMM|nr:MAG: hypothetical protein BECKLPF1236A_GA0070988_100554 [Candidatus Kentron sp. LPFa]VFK24558.1 MAG: hypothetical protein BECKLPF1236C_GA0070990_1001421 [Candidatus Kentron sp. LPFa]
MRFSRIYILFCLHGFNSSHKKFFMKSPKTIIIALALSVMVVMPALASDITRSPAAPVQFTEADIQSLFEQDAGAVPSFSLVELTDGDAQALFEEGAEPMELAMLSPEEMEATEGAVIPLIYGGIIAARYAYMAFRVSGFVVGAYRVIGPAYRGGRLLQVMARNVPKFRLDNHVNPYATKLHMHFGNMKLHRNWYSPWKGR